MRTTPKQDRGQKTINHIIDTAEKLFTEKGYERVSTNLIAQKADMAIGSLYRYFSNKQAILHYMVQKYTWKFIENMKNSTEEMTIIGINNNFFRQTEKLLAQHPVLTEIMFLEMECPKIQKIDKIFKDEINNLQADKYQNIKPDLPRKQALLIAHMAHSTFHHLLFAAKKEAKPKESFDPVIKKEIPKMIEAYLKMYLE